MPTKVLVPPEGPLSAKIAFIGEAPGEYEERYGRPFMPNAPAGGLFDELLRMAGINRIDCYVDNVISERPPNNNISLFIKQSGKSIITTPEYDKYAAQLIDRLKRVQANVYVPLGNPALYTLTGKWGTTKWRGSVLYSEALNAKVIPSVHPSYALRYGNFLYQYYILHDLIRILKDSTTPEMNLPYREYKITPCFDDCLEYLHQCNQASYVSFDIELAFPTKSLVNEIGCISFSKDSKDAISIPFIAGGKDYFTLEQEAIIWVEIARLLENPKVVKVAQYGFFDWTFIFERYGCRIQPTLEDTQVAQGILEPDFKRDLGFIASIHSREPYYKDESKFRRKEGTDHDHWLYNAKDSIVLQDVRPKQCDDLQRSNNVEAYDVERSLIEPLVYLTKRGLRMDKERLKNARTKTEEEMAKVKQEIFEVTNGEIDNPNAHKQVQTYFYITKGIKAYTHRKTGNVTSDDTAMTRIAIRGYKEADTILKFRRLAKMRSTYYGIMFDDDDRLRCSWDFAVSGRLRSSKTLFDTGMNMQNQPKAMREYMLPDEGYIAYSVDLPQAELRIIATIAPEPLMQKAFREGMDIHAQTYSLIYNIPIEEVSYEDNSCPLGNGTRSQRFWGKTANYALPYGMGPNTFSLEYQIPIKDSRPMRERYYAIYPGITRMQEWIKHTIQHKDRTLTNCYGRKRKFREKIDDALFRTAYDWIPQSTVAHKINQEGLRFLYENQQWFAPVEILNQVHDEIWFQISLDHPWQVHADILTRLRDSLSAPISWEGSTFTIPVEEAKLSPRNFKDMKKADISLSSSQEIAKELSRVYQRFLE